MTWRVLQEWRGQYDEILVLFANTGQEDERTLDFVNACDVVFGFKSIWLEAEVPPQKGVGTKHRIVNYSNASRKGEPFEQVISKYGIPNTTMPHCTRELKIAPMQSYVRSLGWSHNTYDRAIGIRADEFDRMPVRAKENRIIYPLVRWNITKGDVLEFWRGQDFDLEIDEHEGNCLWCWRKTKSKLLTLAADRPEVFDFPARMEREYGKVGAMYKNTGESQVFFRKKESTADIIASSKEPFRRFIPNDPEYQYSLELGEMPNGCSESCEVEYF